MNLLQRFLQIIVERAADKVSQEVKSSLSPVAPYLRHLSTGLLFVFVSMFAWFSGLLFLLLSFFFALLNNSLYTLPALWTGLISWALALLLAVIGFNFLRKPR